MTVTADHTWSALMNERTIWRRTRRFGLMLAVMLCCPSTSFGRSHPNVIIILTDDQGYGDLACHGNPELKTPNLTGCTVRASASPISTWLRCARQPAGSS